MGKRRNMKIKPSLILLVSLIFLFIGGLTVNHFSTNKAKEIEITETLNRVGIIYSIYSEKPFTGKVVSRCDNGSIRTIENYENGKLHGISEYFEESYMSYNSNRLSSRRHYNQGQENKFETFRDDGTLDYVLEYKDGVKTNSTVYNKDGSIKTVSEFNNGITKIHVYGNSGYVEFTNHFDKNMNKIKTTYPKTFK